MNKYQLLKFFSMGFLARGILASLFMLFFSEPSFASSSLVYENGTWNWKEDGVRQNPAQGNAFKYGHRMINVKVNGRSYTWLLDTGASRSVISKDMQRMSISPCVPNKYVLYGVGGGQSIVMAVG